jgi:branched-chain amino acid transport system substrate-binding protein
MLLGTAASACALLVTVGAAQAQEGLPDHIKIGVLAGMTGPAAIIGKSMTTAVKLAEKEINQAGGIGGKSVEFIYGDNQSDPTISSTEAKRLVFQEKVNAMIGPGISQEAVPAVLVTTQAKVFQITTATTLDLSRSVAPYHFSMAASARSQSIAMVDYAVKDLQAKRIAILNDDGGASKSSVVAIKQLLAERGVTPIAQQEYPYHVQDLAPQLLALRRADPDVILYLTVSPEDVRQLALTMRDIGWFPRTLGNASMPAFAPGVAKKLDNFPDAFKNMLGTAYRGTTYCHEPLGEPLYAKFFKAVQGFAPEDWEKLPMATVGFDYAITMTVRATLEGAKTVDAAKLADWLYQNAPSIPNPLAPETALGPTSHFLWGPDSLVVIADPDKTREDGLQRRFGC